MATNYPGSLDSGTQQPSPSSSTEMDDSGFEHDVVHTNHSGAIIALETKVGTGDSNAVASSVLAGTGSGTSGWSTAPSLAGLTVDTNTLHVDATNNRVGIGTTSPGQALDVDGSVIISANQNYYINSASTGVGRLRLHWASSTGHAYVDYKDDLYFRADGSGAAVIFKSSGNVGIATTGPTETFDVNGIARIRSTIKLGANQIVLSQVDSDGSMRVQGASGYIDIGPKNSTYCHIYTDRGKFYLNKGINSAPHFFWRDSSGIGGPLTDTSTGTGYRYVFQNQTYGTFFDYSSIRARKDQITNVTEADAGRWIDALQPVTFIERWMGEGEEPEDNKAFREADMQVGFIADDVLDNPDTIHFSQVLDNGEGGFDPAGWKWECVIAASVAEIKALRTRVADLEAA